MDIKERDKKMFELRESGSTLKSIGDKFSISQEQVRQRVAKFKRDLDKQKDEKYELERLLGTRIANAFKAAGLLNKNQVVRALKDRDYNFSDISGYGMGSHKAVCKIFGIKCPYSKSKPFGNPLHEFDSALDFAISLGVENLFLRSSVVNSCVESCFKSETTEKETLLKIITSLYERL